MIPMITFLFPMEVTKAIRYCEIEITDGNEDEGEVVPTCCRPKTM